MDSFENIDIAAINSEVWWPSSLNDNLSIMLLQGRMDVFVFVLPAVVGLSLVHYEVWC